MVHCRQLPKIEPLVFFFPPSSSPFPPPLSEKRERFHRGNFTAGQKAVRDRESSPEMNRGGSLRRRLSSLRGAWRWSTGYLFRKVGCNGGANGWIFLDGFSVYNWRVTWRVVNMDHLLFSCPTLRGLFSPPLLFLCDRIFSHVSFADFYQPPTSFALPPSLLRSLALSQMVNLYGLLVKSTSPDGFHLETGPQDPPLQFPPPPPPHPLPRLTPSFLIQVLKGEKQVLGCGLCAVQALMSLILICFRTSAIGKLIFDHK